MALTLADTRRRAQISRTGKKLTKSEADYKKSSEPEKHRCGICEYFQEPDGCRLVEGIIRAEFGCKFFEKR